MLSSLGAVDPTSALTGSLLVALPLAALAGLLSFASPCVLPLVPGYLSYVTGLTGDELSQRSRTPADDAVMVGAAPVATVGTAGAPAQSRATGQVPWLRSRVVIGTVGFVLGFSVVFVSYGALFGRLGATLLVHQQLITRLLGVVVIAMGLGFLGLIPWLSREARWHHLPRRGLWGAPLLGALFGLGWTPCIGPTLAVVQAMAFTEASALRGALLSLAYCLGLGLPFLVIGLAFERGLGAIRWVRRNSQVVTRIGGAMLVLVGLALVTGVWADAMTRVQSWTSGWVAPL